MLPTLSVIKRDGSIQVASIKKIKNRLCKLADGLKNIRIEIISTKTFELLYVNITTDEIDDLIIKVCIGMISDHLEYQILAGKVAISKLHKNTKEKFSCVVNDLYNYIDPVTNNQSKIIAEEFYKIVMDKKVMLDEYIDNSKDYDIGYFGLQTLLEYYLLKINGKVVERPQYMFMRVAISIHKDNMKDVVETYKLMSERWFIHSSPTLFNSGTNKCQLASCFLASLKSESSEEFFETVKQCAQILEYGGGIGLSLHSVRPKGSLIYETYQLAHGLTPILKIFNGMSKYVNSYGRWKGALAVYLEPWHADIFDFLLLRRYVDESRISQNLFTGLWIPDLFMRRVENNQDWTLMDPFNCPGLSDCWGHDFDVLYESYERDCKGTKTIKACALWKKIIEAQIELGFPYILYKDTCNRLSNQQHLGTIKSSSLCGEIIQYSSADEVAVCCIASISLPKFVDLENRSFNFNKLIDVTKVITQNLNKIIDLNKYPFEEVAISNKLHRPIGIGIQGLADVFALMRYPFDSDEAALLNKQIFETIYFAALRKSCDMAMEFGRYKSFYGSLLSKGILVSDLWNVQYNKHLDWDELRRDIKTYGTRNSLLLALMPTANTSKIFENTKCFEPFNSNLRILSNEFFVFNHYLISDLLKLNLWSDNMKKEIITHKGSIQHIESIPKEIKDLYKTIWEIPQTVIIKMAADRAPFIDQSQSIHLYIDSPDLQKLPSLHFLTWKMGLKTGMYYLNKNKENDVKHVTV